MSKLIYNGVSEPEICDYPEYFKELGIEKGKYILGMCRFVPEKNLHHLVEAFVKWKKTHTDLTDSTDIKLVLAGDTDFEDEYSLGLSRWQGRMVWCLLALSRAESFIRC